MGEIHGGPGAAIAARLQASTDRELVAAATRWHEISEPWQSELFTQDINRELDFHEHFAGYRDPYRLVDLVSARGVGLDPDTRRRLLDYAFAVMSTYELVHFRLTHELVPIPDPWTPGVG